MSQNKSPIYTVPSILVLGSFCEGGLEDESLACAYRPHQQSVLLAQKVSCAFCLPSRDLERALKALFINSIAHYSLVA